VPAFGADVTAVANDGDVASFPCHRLISQLIADLVRKYFLVNYF
jgi:hypothetical protein